MSGEGMTATQKGTAMHKIIQYFDFSKADLIEEEIERLKEWKFISELEVENANRKALQDFFASDIFARIKEAEEVHREMRFLTERPATEIAVGLDAKFADENIVIQGAVDCLFEENGEIVVVDFKTDRVSSEKLLADTYREQLKIYAGACEKIFSKPVKEILLYSFHLGKEIKL
jgi:ATP-dependent helicase/nuclease subunit A